MNTETTKKILIIGYTGNHDLIDSFIKGRFTVESIHVLPQPEGLTVRKPSVILLFVTNPLLSLEFCHIIKSDPFLNDIPLIFFAEENYHSLEISALDAGVDDFVLLPVDPAVVYRRVLLRLGKRLINSINISGTSNYPKLQIDRESYSVYIGKEPVAVSKKEFELLFLLASQPGRIFTREEIFSKVWKRKFEESERTIDVHVLRLRKKIGDSMISTQKGIGYRFMGGC